MDAMAEPNDVREEAREDLEIERRARALRLRRGLRTAARRALVLARRYREEEGPGGAREAACVAQALSWRHDAQEIAVTTAGLAGPGLARATSPASSGDRKDRRAG